MYSILSSVEALGVKSQIREQIFSLLGNTGKTIFFENTSVIAEVHMAWYQKMAAIMHSIWYTPYKKILTYTIIVITSTIIAPSGTSFAAEGGTQKFIVTAYYSPLPGQDSYARGSLEADKKLNGNGTNGASGAPVFTGMIAAPKSYDFGTHIFFEGLGLGRVEDRGGAIVDAWVRGQPHDRIDIWMGHGDAGLKRARAWGVREVTGVFVTEEQAKNLNPIDLEGISNGRVNLKDFPTTKAQSQGGISGDVIEAFAELGYIVQGDDIKDMIFRFQVDQGILTSLSDDGAGSFGPKTKAAFAEEYKKYSTLKQLDIEAIEKARQELLDERTAWETRYEKAQNSVQALRTIKKGDSNTNVLTLQSILMAEGFFKGKMDGHMKTPTLLALRKYQKANGLKSTGRIDRPTQQALISDMLEA